MPLCAFKSTPALRKVMPEQQHAMNRAGRIVLILL